MTRRFRHGAVLRLRAMDQGDEAVPFHEVLVGHRTSGCAAPHALRHFCPAGQPLSAAGCNPTRPGSFAFSMTGPFGSTNSVRKPSRRARTTGSFVSWWSSDNLLARSSPYCATWLCTKSRALAEFISIRRSKEPAIAGACFTPVGSNGARHGTPLRLCAPGIPSGQHPPRAFGQSARRGKIGSRASVTPRAGRAGLGCVRP
jgi:hypothetical protein